MVGSSARTTTFSPAAEEAGPDRFSPRPCLRRDLVITEQVRDQKTTFVIKNPASQTYFSCGSVEMKLLSLLDGSVTVDGLANAARERHGLRLSLRTVQTFLAELKRRELLERSPAEALLLLREHQLARRKQARRGFAGRYLVMSFSLFDPDRLLGYFEPRLRFLMSRPVLAVTAALVAAGFARILLRGMSLEPGESLGVVPWKWHHPLLTFLLLQATLVAHELGHAFACKHYGGEVREIGLMLFYFTMPAMYVNVSDAWLFPARRQKLWVTFAGGYVQATLGAAAGIVAMLIGTGSELTIVLDQVFVMTCGTALLFNFNPLIKLDGYYALVDILEVPRLRERSFAYLRRCLAAAVGHAAAETSPDPTLRERRIFRLYGVAAALYTGIFLTVGLSAIAQALAASYQWVGVAVFALLVVRLVGSQARKAGSVLVSSLRRRAGRRRALVSIGAVLMLAALAVFGRVSREVRGEGHIVAASEIAWRAPRSGIAIPAVGRGAAVVRANSIVFEIRDHDLEARLDDARRELETQHWSVLQAAAGDDSAAAAVLGAREMSLRSRVAALERERDATVVRAPFDAIVLTPRFWQRAGQAVSEGEEVCRLGDAKAVYFSAMVPAVDVLGARPGATVRVRLRARPQVALTGTVVSVASEPIKAEDAENRRDESLYEVRVALEAADAGVRLLPGLTGVAAIDAGTHSPIDAAWHAIRRAVRADLWV
ncbi:MAG: HlyD family efflux transporter periplasmic adaptor subunit [Candidatus Schekmanbacteria bacterium]|nr:HlyD family efflux transporter periplasmic adaptor subunit [Candidatus Schekmanbacteria bacterium]